MYLIIGGNSFIGVYTVDAFLQAGYKVAVTARNTRLQGYYAEKGVDLYLLDIANKQDFLKLPQEEIDGVVLLGGLLPANAKADLIDDENAAEYIAVNTIGTCNVLEYCRKNQIPRLISTTSYSDLSGHFSQDKRITEDLPRSFPFNGDHCAYVISKNAAADIMQYYNQQHGMSNAVFRLPPVYGVGPHGSLLVNGKLYKSGLQVFIDKAKSGETIEVYGNTAVTRDVVYVKDVAEAFVAAMKAEKVDGYYNISGGRGVSLLEQANVVADVYASNNGKSAVVERKDKENRSVSYIFDISKAQRDFGYAPRYVSFDAMMRDYKSEEDRGHYAKLF